MNDRYLYRAKRKSDKMWIYGNLIQTDDGVYIIQNYVPQHLIGKYEVDPSTICQCTGLKDKNGKLIWENDIVIINGWIGKVMWSSNDTAYIVLPNDDIKNETYCLGYWANEYNVEVIGNEIDNPELLEVGE